ncbi:MAG TPA: hypothetical protein P5186_25545 [Candidatus Paceibacterota bacterium]|nr:hypothetical protein [Candidatus Paceibacterota bacterium]
MPGYLILPEEACDWSGDQPGKVRLHPTRLNLFDLIRAFEQDPFPYTARTPGVCLITLDDLLVQTKQLEDPNETRDWPFLQDIRRRLRAVANDVSNMGTIHVPIRLPLNLGAAGQLYLHYTGRRIPLWRIFGCHPTISSVDRHETYQYTATLS